MCPAKETHDHPVKVKIHDYSDCTLFIFFWEPSCNSGNIVPSSHSYPNFKINLYIIFIYIHGSNIINKSKEVINPKVRVVSTSGVWNGEMRSRRGTLEASKTLALF